MSNDGGEQPKRKMSIEVMVAGIGLAGVIVAAIIGLIGAIIQANSTVDAEAIRLTERALDRAETSEALTLQAQLATAAPIATDTPTPEPTEKPTNTPTDTEQPTPTYTDLPTATPTDQPTSTVTASPATPPTPPTPTDTPTHTVTPPSESQQAFNTISITLTSTLTEVSRSYPCPATIVEREVTLLNVVRSQPRADAPHRTAVRPGENVMLLQETTDESSSDRWFRIEYQDNLRGWILALYAIPSDSCPQ